MKGLDIGTIARKLRTAADALDDLGLSMGRPAAKRVDPQVVAQVREDIKRISKPHWTQTAKGRATLRRSMKASWRRKKAATK